MYAKLSYNSNALHDEDVVYIIFIIRETQLDIYGKVLYTNYYNQSIGKVFNFDKNLFVEISRYNTEEELLKEHILELI